MNVFETLLLNQSAATGTNDNADNDDNNGGLKQPRPSRYATLIPREALRQNNASVVVGGALDANKKQHRQRSRSLSDVGNYNVSKELPLAENMVDVDNVDGTVCNNSSATTTNSGEDEIIRVYKKDKVTGQLELLTEEDYDLIYYNDWDAEEKSDGILQHGGDTDDVEMKDGDYDTKGDKIKKDDEIGVDNIQSDENENQDDLIYIVKTPKSLPHINLQPPDIDDTESSTSSSDYNELHIDMLQSSSNNFNSTTKPPIQPSISSTLARALVSRTDGFDKLRPSYAMLLANEEREKLEKDKKKKEKQLKKKLASSPSSAADKLKLPNKSILPDGTSTSDTNDSTLASKMSLLQTSHKIISSLPPNSNIYDGDSPTTILNLNKMRKWQENHVDPKMQGIELDNWEDGIDWNGCASDSSDDEDDDKKKEGKKSGDAMEVDLTNNNVAASAKQVSGGETTTEDEGDCTPDFNTSDCFQPPIPFGGHPKRARRAFPEYDDPIQLLLEPRNPRLDALDLASTVDWEGATSDTEDEPPIRVPLILQSSIAGQSVATLLAPNPISRPLPFESHPNYQQRYEREMSSAITSTADLIKPGTFGAHEALEKYKEARQRKREQMAKDKQSRVKEVMNALSLTGTGRRITSSLMGPGGAERTGRPSRHALGSTSVHDAEYVEQLELVYNHSLVKPALTLSEARQFHRPRLPLAVVNTTCPWQLQARVVTENKRGSDRGASLAADGSTIVGSYHAMMSAGAKGQSKIRSEADLSPSIGDLVVLEYVEERLSLFMTKGTTCRIVNYYRGDRSRCPISAGGGDRPLRKRHGDKAASAKGPTPSGPSNRAERPPRLNKYKMKSPADLIGISTKKKKKKSMDTVDEAKKENVIDVLPEGVTEILHQKVHGPFIGEVEEGKAQTGLISNLFVAPMFRHESEPTDFLMICGQLKAKPKFAGPTDPSGGLEVVLRSLPQNIFCVGQTEPRVKVFGPNTNDEKKFTNAFIPFQIAKNIQRAEEHSDDGSGLSFDYIKDKLFANSLVPHAQLRIRLKHVANFQRANDHVYNLKATGEDDFLGVDALGRKVSPEGVAAYESQCAAIIRMQDLGLKELYSGGNTLANVASVMIYLHGAVQAAIERRIKMKKVLEMKRRQKSPQLDYFEKAFEKLDEQYKEVKKRQEVAKFIYEELQLSPWNLSSEFIDVHKRATGGAMMKLTGIGDPSGVGEGYNFLCEAGGRSSKKTTATSNGALDAQIKKITGTENDLRKLTMKQMASLLRSYGMKDKQISVLKRWDRVHVIRDLSTKAASDGMGDEMERFARGEKVRLSDQRQNYKERIQEISRRQIAALSADAGTSDGGAQSDMAEDLAKDKSEVEAESKAGKEKDDVSDKSDSDDDDFFAEMEMEMTNTGEANRLVSGLRRDGGGKDLDSQALSKDAREFAALQRQREEEKAMQEGLSQKTGFGMGTMPKKKTKVIRRKITRTLPDGTQSVTFEFIVNKEKVDSIIEKKKQKDADEKKKEEKKRKKKAVVIDEADFENNCVGHAMFEDDDNAKRRSKIKIKRETKVVSRKSGPMKGSHSKLTSSIKHSRAQAQENRRLKREKKEAEAELYTKHSTGKGVNRRQERGSSREQMPHVILSDRLESLRAAVEARPHAGAFHKPVPRDMIPHYYEIITHPIDLTTIRDKNRKYAYSTAEDFVKDFELMKINAIKFNGKGTPIANEAVDIWEAIRTAVKSNRVELNEMEEAVRDQKSGKKKKKKKAQAESSSSSNKPMNTANIVLDGVETQVNLGNLPFGLGSDSDSDSD